MTESRLPAWRWRLAVACLRRGGIVAYPSEGVWGLGCDPRNEQAVRRLLAIKQRSWRKGLILAAADLDQVRRWASPLSPAQLAILQAHWPGAHTFVLPVPRQHPRWLSGQHRHQAFRVSAHPVVRTLSASFGDLIVSTSANLSGRPAARTALQVRKQLRRRIDLLLPGELGGLRGPTPITVLSSGAVLRESCSSTASCARVSPHPAG